ncbi:acylphosphatase [Pseudomarimonas arenosa]|uniref:acylphosphatase n=1 Tax=Pseudomarimonas arenosa TaxID=2774145 RepID=A0AAW3ZHP7_9GAMM|nr:acylphosphatase [Pseudomarimonas arenosa]MBD8525541.1 acylphosphatase [Pseudomarimonas arenosa]
MSDSAQSEPAAARFLLSGRVQGVGFRAATRREAQRLALSGHAINLPDGRVEVVAEGEPRAITELAAWLQQGPPFSQVNSIDRDEIEVKGRSGFGVG